MKSSPKGSPHHPAQLAFAAQTGALQAMLESVPASAFAVDRNFCYLAFNHLHVERMRAMYAAQVALGLNMLDGLSFEVDRQKMQGALELALSGEEHLQIAYTAQDLKFEVRFVPIRDENGTVTGVSVVSQDVTEKLSAAEDLKRSDALYRELFDHISSYILILDAQTYAILDANPAACSFYGYTHAELTGMTVMDLNQATTVEMQARVNTVLGGDSNLKGILHRLANGELRDVEIFSGPLNYNGRPALLSVLHDVTARTRDQERIAEALELNQTILEASPAGIIIYAANGDCIAANSMAGKLTGTTRQELLRQNFHSIPPWKENGLYAAALQALSTGQPVAAEAHNVSTFGQKIWARGSFTPFTVSGEKHLMFMFEDVSARRQAELALGESEERHRLLFENSQDAILLTSLDGQVYDSNPAATRMFGWSAEEFRRLERAAIIDPDDPRLGPAMAEAGRTAHFSGELSVVRKDGLKVPVEISSSAFRDRDGNARASLFIHDISARKQAEEALRVNEQNTRVMLNTMTEAIVLNEIVYDENGIMLDYRILNVNQAFYAMVKPYVSPVIGNLASQVYGLSPEIIREFWESQRSKGRTSFAEVESPFNQRWYLVATSPFMDNKFVTTFLDITERKQAEVIKQESFDRLQKITSRVPGIVYQFQLRPDGSFCFPFTSDAVRHLYRLTPEELREDASKAFAIVHPDDLPGLQASIQASARDLSPWQYEYRVRFEDGTTRHLYGNSVPEREPDGSVIWTGFLTDITDRKNIEMALQASEAQYRTLIDLLPTGVMLQRGGTILLANQASARFFGADGPQQLVGMQIIERIHPDYRAIVTRRIQQVEKEQGTAPWIEEKLLRLDGTSFDAEVAAMPVIYQDQPARLAAYIDISERKRAEQAIRQSEERYRRLVETSPDVVYRFSNQRGAIYYSNRVEQILGYTPAEMLAQPLLWHDSIHPDDLPRIEQVIASSPQSKRVDLEYRIRDRGGNWHWLVDRRIGSLTEGDEIIVEGLATDITARKQAEMELQAAHDQLEQRVQDRTADLLAANLELEKLSRAKDQFLSTMSHELRTPLTGILGLTQVLLFNTYGPLNEKQTRALQNIEKSGQHLHELINDILDLSRLQNGKLRLERQPTSLFNVCRASLQMVNNLAAAKHQELTLECTPENIILNADERRLKQIVINLLGNAIKFTPEGGRIQVIVTGQPEQHQVRLVVQDTGIGIQPEDLPRLFQPFVQLDSSLARQYNGTGLGLSLVKSLTDLHNGSIELESTPGQGSRFTITLPWEPEAQHGVKPG